MYTLVLSPQDLAALLRLLDNLTDGDNIGTPEAVEAAALSQTIIDQTEGQS